MTLLFDALRPARAVRRFFSQRAPAAPQYFDSLEPRQLMSAVKASVTSLRVISGSDTSTLGATVQLSAVVAGKSSAGVPTGSVTFKAGKTNLGTGILNSKGIARIDATNVPFGETSITAVYSGSGKFATSSTAGLTFTVSAGSTTIKLATPTTSTIGAGTLLVARMTSAAGEVPTGKVGFYDGSTLLGTGKLNSIGAARMTANYLYIGAHSIKAVYFGSERLLGHRSVPQTSTVVFPTLSAKTDGLKTGITTAGTGNGAVADDVLSVNYTGWVASNGVMFQSTLDTGTPFQFTLGAGSVIPGWDEGLVGAKVGEKRVLILPPSLAYGQSAQRLIPANSTLVFVVEIVAIS